MRTTKPYARIEGWGVVSACDRASYAELRPGNLLAGRVLDHPRMDGEVFIFSSAIVTADLTAGIVETRNTSYRLGQVSRDYDAWRKGEVAAAA